MNELLSVIDSFDSKGSIIGNAKNGGGGDGGKVSAVVSILTLVMFARIWVNV